MTTQRRDGHGTEYGDWTRIQPSIDSKLGYLSTNIDYMWKDDNGNWMLIEEKRRAGSDVCNNLPKPWQVNMYDPDLEEK